MKLRHILGNTRFTASVIPLILSVCFHDPAQAANISGGGLILNIDRDALIAGVVLDNYPDQPTESFPICCRPSIYVEEFFGASTASKFFAELVTDNTPNLDDLQSDEIVANGLLFSVNGAILPENAPGRVNKPTTFTFDPADLAGTAAGKIGLNGVIRFRVDVTPPSNRVLLGDMDLRYDADFEDVASGRSGWQLVNNIGFTAGGFDLYDVTTELTANSLSLSGILGLGDGFDHLGGIRGYQVGAFTFQTTVVPLPAAVWLFGTGLGAVFISGRGKKRTV